MPDYTPESFYCLSVDKRGHSDQVRVHPDTYGNVSILVSDVTLPYRTPQDFARDAMTHRWHWLAENTDNELIKKESARLAAQAELDRQSRVVEAERSLCRSLRDNVNDPEKRMLLTREQIDAALASFSIKALRDEAERVVSGLYL